MSTTTSQNQTGSSLAQTPSWLTPYYKAGAQGAESAMGSIPSLANLYNMVPGLSVPNITSQQQAGINAAQNQIGAVPGEFNTGVGTLTGVAGAASPGQSALAGVAGSAAPGQSALENFLGSPGAPSSATQAELAQFKDITAPQILQNSVLAGQGNSGAADAALAMGQEAALVPFMQQDLANTLQAGSTLYGGGANAASTLFGGGAQAGANLAQTGLAQANLTQQQITNALTAAGLPYDVAQKQAAAIYQQQAQQFQYAQDIQGGPVSQFPNLIGQTQQLGSSTSTAGLI